MPSFTSPTTPFPATVPPHSPSPQVSVATSLSQSALSQPTGGAIASTLRLNPGTHSGPHSGSSSVVPIGPGQDSMKTRLIQFLREDLAVSESALAIMTRHQETDAKLLPMVLWQYGLVTLEELDRIFDWMESA